MATGTLKMWKADRGFGFIKGRLWRFGYVSPHQRAAIGGKEKAQRYATDPEYRASLIARKAWEKAKGK